MLPITFSTLFPEFVTLTNRCHEYVKGEYAGAGPKGVHGASRPGTGSRCGPCLGYPSGWGQRPVPPARGALVFPIRQICGGLRSLLSPGPAQPSETSWTAARSGPPIGGRRTVGGPPWRPSKLACSEGWPCSAGRRLVLPDGGSRFGRGRKLAAGPAQVSLRHARLRRAGSGWGHAGALGSARVRGCSFVRGRLPSRRRGVWSLSSPSWARRTLGAAALLPPSREEKVPCSVWLLHTLDSEV